MNEERKPYSIEPATPLDCDMMDPILNNEIEFSPERIAFLEKRVTTCFKCRWILEDYRANGTLKGYRSSDGQFEIFPLRGEIDHLYIELHGKPYPWREPVNEYESKPHAFTKDERLVAVDPVVAPTPRPDQSKKEDEKGPAITIKQDPNAVPLSKPKQRPGNVRF